MAASASYVGSTIDTDATSDHLKVSFEPMPEKDAQKLTQHFDYLEKTIDASYLTAHLFSKFIINEDDMKTINKIPEKRNRNRDLLTTLLSRGDRALDIFIAGLKQNNYCDAVERLTSETGPDEDTCSKEDPETLRRKIQSLEVTNKQLRQLLNVSESEKRLKEYRITAQQKTIQASQKELTNLKAEMNQLQSEYSKLKSENSELRSEYSKQKSENLEIRLECSEIKAEIGEVKTEMRLRFDALEKKKEKGKNVKKNKWKNK